MVMHRKALTRILAILLTFSMTSEIATYSVIEEFIALEIDADGEQEEEKKNDQFTETIQLPELCFLINYHSIQGSHLHSVFSWKTPLIDHQTPPPKLG